MTVSMEGEKVLHTTIAFRGQSPWWPRSEGLRACTSRAFQAFRGDEGSLPRFPCFAHRNQGESLRPRVAGRHCSLEKGSREQFLLQSPQAFLKNSSGMHSDQEPGGPGGEVRSVAGI